VTTANGEASVVYVTLSIDGDLSGAERAAIDDTAGRQGGTVVWRTSEAAGRSYALLELPDRQGVGAIRASFDGTMYEGPVIALALFPTTPEALPSLLEALGGAGRPSGILTCGPCPGGVVVEWNPSVTEPRVIMGVVDVELRRFGGGRTAELLSPLPPALTAGIAANGLQTPQIEPKRILEARIDGA
jgi:hypothetical protein